MKKHAYLVMAHEDRYQLEQLLSLLDDERNDVFLQVDSKGGLSTDNLSLAHSRLFVLPSFPIFWGGLSMIQAELNLLKAAREQDYHYHHLITGADLPLVSQDTVHARLLDSDLEYVDFAPEHQSSAHWKAAYYHFWVENNWYRKYLPVRALSHGTVAIQKVLGFDRSKATKECYYHGSAYFSITRKLVEHVCDNERWILDTFNHTIACDEVFLQTLVMKSPFRSRVVRDGSLMAGNLRCIDWKRRSGNSPYTFRNSDYEELREASSYCLFARKFRRAVDPAIIDTIVDRIRREGTL